MLELKANFHFRRQKIPLWAPNYYWNPCVCFTDIDIVLELLRLKAGGNVTFGISVAPEIPCKGPTVCWKNFLRRVSWDWTGHSAATLLPDASTWKLSDSAATRTHVPSTATASSLTGGDGHFICSREKPRPGPDQDPSLSASLDRNICFNTEYRTPFTHYNFTFKYILNIHVIYTLHI